MVWKCFWSISGNPSLYIWYNLLGKPPVGLNFLLELFLIANSISFLRDFLFILESISVIYIFLKMYLLHVGYIFCWHIQLFFLLPYNLFDFVTGGSAQVGSQFPLPVLSSTPPSPATQFPSSVPSPAPSLPGKPTGVRHIMEMNATHYITIH